MDDPNTPPAEAYDPDPDRADQDSPDLMPAWAAYLIALLILFMLQHSQSMQQRRAHRLASRPTAKSLLPQDSSQPPAAATGSHPDDGTAPTRRSRAAAPACPEELPHVLQVLLARLQQCDNGPSVWSQLAALGIVPGLLDLDAAATPAAPMPSRRPIATFAKIRPVPRTMSPAGARHRMPPAPWRRTRVGAGTGPPTGPPVISGYQSCYV
ncbi:MAG TPA: hypothetical protein VGG99_01580 [Acetobacteraceae bacterium]|jgi:hypothetical protein